jgi:hypothetical protein
MSVNTPRRSRPSTDSDRSAANGRTIRSLTVVAGPAAVGKTRLLEHLATDEQLRDRLRVPRAPTVTAGEFFKRSPSGPIDELILHYDILSPHHKGLESHTADPAMSMLDHAETIAFFTLRTTHERLVAQLNGRITARRHVPWKLRKLRPLYESDLFVADWYERWFAFVKRFREVTERNYLIDVHRGYALAEVSAYSTLPSSR